MPLSESPPEEPLDTEQLAAVETPDRAIAVLAGPGSGKTRVLSYRARHLLRGDRGEKALLLTFTNKAAAEMKARALDVAVVTSDRIWASTFHTFGMNVLGAHGDLLGLERDFEIPDDEEQTEIQELAASRAGTSNRARRWSYLRLRRQAPNENEVVRWAEAYEELKRADGVLDFDDLVVYTADLLEQREELARAYATQYPHLLVDEFQDTNPAQFAIVRALADHAKTVSVFADDDQAIYQFTGAEPKNIRRFVDQLEATEFPLTTNYRCLAEIVGVANRLIAADDQASGRRMNAHYGGGEVAAVVFETMSDEAAALVDEIEALLDKGVHPASIAVLARTAFALTLLRGSLNGVASQFRIGSVPRINLKSGELWRFASRSYAVVSVTDRPGVFSSSFRSTRLRNAIRSRSFRRMGTFPPASGCGSSARSSGMAGTFAPS